MSKLQDIEKEMNNLLNGIRQQLANATYEELIVARHYVKCNYSDTRVVKEVTSMIESELAKKHPL